MATILDRMAAILDKQDAVTKTTACPTCRALPGEPCHKPVVLISSVGLPKVTRKPHKARIERAEQSKPRIAARGACADKGEAHAFNANGICAKCHTYA
jgi:hypothetical protein